MEQWEIFICGNFGYTTGQLDGQTVKTRVLKDEIANIIGQERVAFSDTSGWKRDPLSLFMDIRRKFRNSRYIVILPARKGIRVILPLLVGWKKKYHKDLRYIVIGGWLPALLEKKTAFMENCRQLDGIYVEVPSMKDKLNQLGLTNVTVMSNFRNFIKKPCKERAISLPLKAVFCSRILKQKGIALAIEAVRRINRDADHPSILLDIYGQINSGYREEFEQGMEKAGRGVVYQGVLAPESIQQRLGAYDLMLFPTYYDGEGFPGAILDAFAAGIPVVASDWKYNREVVDEHETGLLFRTGDIDGMVAALKQFIDNPQQLIAMQDNCLKQAEKYHVDKIIPNFLRDLE